MKDNDRQKDDGSLSRLKAELKNGLPGRMYIFHGDEDYLRRYYIEQMRNILAEPGGMNHTRIEGVGCTTDALREAAESYPMLGSRRLVEIHDFDITNPGAAAQADCADIIRNLPETSCLIFSYDTVKYSPPKNKELAAAIAENCLTVAFHRQGENELARWISRRFAALGVDCDRDTACYMIARCGGIMAALVPEIEKSAAYLGKGRISRREIDEVTAPTLEAAIYEMTDAVSGGRPGRAFELAQNLINQKEDPIAMIQALGRTFRQIYIASLLPPGQDGQSEWMSICRVKSRYAARRVFDCAARYRLPPLRRAVMLCAKADHDSKRLPTDRRVLLEQLIYSLSRVR